MKKTKEMTISELQMRYAELKEQANVINDKLEAEARCMNDAERSEWDTITREADAIKRELQLRSMSELPEEREGAMRARVAMASIVENTKERQASGAKFRQFINNRCGELQIELRESLTATGTTDAPNVIPVLTQDFINPLEKGLILSKLGIRIKTGLSANVKYPIMPSFEANFVNEKEKVADTVINDSALTPKPRRIAISAPITDLENLQSNGKLYVWIIENIALAVARTLNRWLAQTTAIVTDVYGAMAYNATANKIQQVPFAGAVPTYAELVAMRGKVQKTGAYNDGTYAYIMSGALSATLESTRRFESGDTPILVDGKIAGCPVLLSEFIEATGPNKFNETPKHVGFARWSDLILGQFGSMKLTIDPYTGSKAGVLNIVLDTHYSVDLIRPESFVIGTITA